MQNARQRRYATPDGRPDPKHQPRGFTYKSYSFVDKDPIIFEVEEAIHRSGLSALEIERRSGVSCECLHKWFRGRTRRPQACTIRAVLRAIGADLVVAMPGAPAKPRLTVMRGGKR